MSPPRSPSGNPTSDVKCPRCYAANLPAARFCGRCGFFLEPPQRTDGVGAALGRHPDALDAPKGFVPVADAANLHFRRLPGWGGSASTGIETAAVELFNGGYALRSVVLRFRGRDGAGIDVFAVERSLAEWPRGETVRIELQSFDIPAPAESLEVALVSADFAPAGA